MDSSSSPCFERRAVERADALLQACTPRCAVLVPTSSSTLDALVRWRSAWPDLLVVAPGLPGGLDPHELLTRLGRSTPLPERIVLFADQLVSPVHARIPVRRAEDLRYVSGLEALLVVRHDYHLASALPPQEGEDPACSDAHAAFELAIDFLDRCELLGDAWRVRTSQTERTMQARVDAARRELRYLESAVLHAAAGPARHDVTAVLARLRATHKMLKQAPAMEASHAA